MEKIIIKKGENRVANSGDAIGFFKPIFIDKDNNYIQAKPEDFPNDGVIYMPKKTDSFDSNVFYCVEREDIKINTQYEDRLRAYQENPGLQSPSKFIIHSNKLYDILPTDLITVYSNKFYINTKKLIDSKETDSEIFFLENSNDLFGPFKRNNIELSAVNFKSYEDEFENSDDFMEFLELYSEYNGEFIFKIDKDDISNFLISDIENNLYLTDFKSIIKNNIGESLLFCDDSNLLDWGKRKLNLHNPKLKEILDSINELSDRVGNDKLKWDRFKELIQNDTGEEEISDVKNILLKKGVLETKDDSKQNEEVEELKKKIEVKDKEIVELKSEIEQTKLEQLNVTDSKLNLTEYPKVIQDALKDYNKLEELLKESTSVDYYKGQNKTLKDQYDSENIKLSNLRDEKEKLNAETQKIISSFNSAKDNLTSDLAKAKIYTDLLNGIDVGSLQSSSKDENTEFKPTIIEVSKNSAKDYVLEIKERLKNQARDLSFNDVANLIITVNQSFLTILAGAPGVGKTSLANKFSKSLGLSEQFGYLEIACAKGWNSTKDLIGFYNPITQKFQDAKTKLRNALKASSNFKNAPFIVLLDEANLSPMEHYWSDFIKLADFDYERKIKISDKEALEFGNGFRFLATINHDHTTEMLSNRLLDRVSIIPLEKPTNGSIYNPNSQIYNEIFDYDSVVKLFKKESSIWTAQSGWLNNKLDEIIKLLEENHSGLIISPRKRNSVIKYMQVATGLLDGNDYVALDFAISQQILPLINMRGEKHLETLLKIKEILQKVGMVKSTSLLSKIVERGKDNFNHFKYIYY